MMQRIPPEFDPTVDEGPLTFKHHVKIELLLPFWKEFPILVDAYFVRSVTLNNIIPPTLDEYESGEIPMETGLLPFTHSRSYGQGSHLEEIDEARLRESIPYNRGVRAAERGKDLNDNPYLPGENLDEQRDWLQGYNAASKSKGIDPDDYYYFGSMAELWSLLIVVPDNIVRVPGASFAAVVNPTLPWGTLQDEIEGRLVVNTEYSHEEVLYAMFSDQGGMPLDEQLDSHYDLGTKEYAFIDHHLGNILEKALMFNNLEWQHPGVQKAFESYHNANIHRLPFSLQ